jgi:hypothetical protein
VDDTVTRRGDEDKRTGETEDKGSKRTRDKRTGKTRKDRRWRQEDGLFSQEEHGWQD